MEYYIQSRVSVSSLFQAILYIGSNFVGWYANLVWLLYHFLLNCFLERRPPNIIIRTVCYQGSKLWTIYSYSLIIFNRVRTFTNPSTELTAWLASFVKSRIRMYHNQHQKYPKSTTRSGHISVHCTAMEDNDRRTWRITRSLPDKVRKPLKNMLIWRFILFNK